MTRTPLPDHETRLAQTSRVEAFSDGVFAIIVTLLVLEIHRPTITPGHLGQDLLHAWPSYASYALVFLYVGIIWLNHHELFKHIYKVDLPLNCINLGGLGMTSLLPFPTGVMADAFRFGDLDDQRAAVVLYAIIAGLMSAAWLPIFPYLNRHPYLLAPHAKEGMMGAQTIRPIIGVLSYGVAALLGWFVHPLLAVGFFIFMIGYHAFTSQGVMPRRK